MHDNAHVLILLYVHTTDVLCLNEKLKSFHPCMMGRATVESFDYSFQTVNYTGETVHSDLCEKLPV